jgi:hypothetical protein
VFMIRCILLGKYGLLPEVGLWVIKYLLKSVVDSSAYISAESDKHYK